MNTFAISALVGPYGSYDKVCIFMVACGENFKIAREFLIHWIRLSSLEKLGPGQDFFCVV